MAVGESRGRAGAKRPREVEEPVYEGTPGRTRMRSIHVPQPDGFVRAVQVYDVVNTATHPQLREPALSGALNRLESGEALALPFVFHDPAARKLALMVPESLRHDALRLRAELLAELARDAEHPVPSYAREASAVVGLAELALHLERPNGATALGALAQREDELTRREAALEQRAGELDAQLATLGQRESRLVARAEEVTRREDELRASAEEIEALKADVAMREQDLEARFEMLRQRELDLAQRSEGLPAAVDALDLVDEVEDVDDLDPIPTSPGELREAVELVDELVDGGEALLEDVQLVDEAPAAGGLADEVEALVDDDDDVEELDEVESIGDVTGIHAGLIQEDTDLRPKPRTEPPPPPSSPIALPASERPSVAPPRGFLEDAAPLTAIRESDGGVRLFARVDEDAAFAGEPDLLAQLVSIEERPVVLLALVDEQAPEPRVLRAALDPRAQGDRAILEALRRRFAARVSLHSEAGHHLRSIEVSAPREVNVARILERVSRTRTASAIDAATAMKRALDAPPPVRAEDHPFTDAELGASATEVADALGALAAWSSHDKLDHALLVLSIPRDRVDGTARRVLSAAVEHGLALTGGLPDRAISLGVAPDLASLVGQSIEAFTETCAGGGLGAERVAENWERLLKMAAENEVAIDATTHDLAWRLIREVRGGGEGPAIDPAKLPEMGVPELVLLLEHPRHRRDAALELCRRTVASGGRESASLADTLSKSVRKMPRAEVVRVVPRLSELGEDAGDAIIDGLSARKTFVRQAFALALGHLKLRRAVVPLVHLLASEESEVWRELARVVGSFGTASLRNVTRQLRDPKGSEERYAWTLAHLANHGCAKQVERLAGDDNPKLAAIARKATGLREEARAIEDEVGGEAALREGDAVLAFSRRFYQELQGQAPQGDLEDGPGTET